MQDTLPDRGIEIAVRQTFTWSRYRWDISRMLRDIDSQALKPKRTTVDRAFIEGYAKSNLGVTLESDAPTSLGLIACCDVDKARALPLEALTTPIIILPIVLEQATYHLIGDGNHRLVKGLFALAQSLPAYQLSKAQSGRYRLR